MKKFLTDNKEMITNCSLGMSDYFLQSRQCTKGKMSECQPEITKHVGGI
jgi:hypothetical protein